MILLGARSREGAVNANYVLFLSHGIDATVWRGWGEKHGNTLEQSRGKVSEHPWLLTARC
jgi:hypothetical protein